MAKIIASNAQAVFVTVALYQLFSRAIQYNVSTVRVEDVLKRLLNTMKAPQPWDRVARQVAGRQRYQIDILRGILEGYVEWLQANLFDLFLDRFEVGRYCNLIWRSMPEELEGCFEEWHMENFNGKQPAQAPTANNQHSSE